MRRVPRSDSAGCCCRGGDQSMSYFYSHKDCPRPFKPGAKHCNNCTLIKVHTQQSQLQTLQKMAIKMFLPNRLRASVFRPQHQTLKQPHSKDSFSITLHLPSVVPRTEHYNNHTAEAHIQPSSTDPMPFFVDTKKCNNYTVI